ncbi:MAG: phosphoribosylglycinamide formyltransferase [Alphaproteobacteria bacterium]
MLKLAILISGRGSNLAALITAIEQQNLHCKIVCVIANKQAQGLEIAEAHAITTKLIARAKYPSKHAHEIAVLNELEKHQADWIFLAGYMAVLSGEFVDKVKGQIINIHPSLLPKFKGLNTHERALESGEVRHGATIHIVTSKLDDGPIIAQSELSIRANDTPETLASRVLREEHILYPLVLTSLVNNQLEISESKVIWHQMPPSNNNLASQKNYTAKIVSNSYLKLQNLD